MNRYVLIICAFAAWGALAQAHAQAPVDAKTAFTERQADLVALAGHLGALHRLRQLCAYTENVDLFRNRMRELVPLEAPMGRTRLDMIAAFNEQYRSQSTAHLTCSDEARTTYETEAAAALTVTNRLYAPFAQRAN